MNVIFVSAYLEIECQLIAKIMNYSLNPDFLFSFCRIFCQITYIFNTYSLFYRGYRFHFNQTNWDHQDEVLAPSFTGWLSIKKWSVLNDRTKKSSRPLFSGVVIELFSTTMLSKRNNSSRPLFFGVVIECYQMVTKEYSEIRSRPLFSGVVIDQQHTKER